MRYRDRAMISHGPRTGVPSSMCQWLIKQCQYVITGALSGAIEIERTGVPVHKEPAPSLTKHLTCLPRSLRFKKLID